jgi:DHA1 family bicyclomycin/chloramphenicol resistance-like MFS transporter
MKATNNKQVSIVLILAFLTALEPLSIDLFLPAFIEIAAQFKTTPANVQLSLSTFLGGFALGQLLWGPLADRYGRKRPLIVSLVLFSIASFSCLYVQTIEQLWGVRFIQAVGGSGGIVIARAVVTDYFDNKDTLNVFAILALIMGVAPIIAPVIGNELIKLGNWKYPFGTMGLLGAAGVILTVFRLPETFRGNASVITPGTVARNSVWSDYLAVIKVRQFLLYSLVAGIVNGSLMLYIGNAPFLIMDKAGYSGDMFGMIFAANAVGMMGSSYLTSKLQKNHSTRWIITTATTLMTLTALVFVILVLTDASFPILLLALFFYVFPMGMLFPTTTDLAMNPFVTHNSGSASSLFGALQLGIAFVITLVASQFSGGSIFAIGIAFLVTAALIIPFLLLEKTAGDLL